MELLVVIAIIALLLSILMPSLGRARTAAMRLKCSHNLKQIDLAVHLYLDDNDDTYPCAEDPLPSGKWLWMGRGWRGFVEPYLGDNINANNPSVLWCPQDRTARYDYESTSYAYSMAFYHSPEQIDAMSGVEDNYKNPQHSIQQKRTGVAHPSRKILIGEWLSSHQRTEEEDKGWWCWQGSRNYLFANGKVRYIKAEDILPANDGFPNPNLTTHGINGLDLPLGAGAKIQE